MAEGQWPQRLVGAERVRVDRQRLPRRRQARRVLGRGGRGGAVAEQGDGSERRDRAAVGRGVPGVGTLTRSRPSRDSMAI